MKRLVLLAALAVMPAQGIASTLLVLFCHGDAQAHSTHSGGNSDHSTQSNDHHGNQQSANDSSVDGSVFHQCCNFTATALISMVPVLAPMDFPVLVLSPDTLHDLFIPDRPQRPPLA